MIPEPWSGVQIGVLGLGRSGRGAARLLRRAGARVYASDISTGPELESAVRELVDDGIDAEIGGHDHARLGRCDLLVVSPGIPPTAGVLQAPEVQGRPIVSELELAFNFLRAPVIAITGTNGKTTTTAMVGALLAESGELVIGVGGNIGRPLSELAASDTAYDWIVAEVSSFQLAHTVRFKPAIGVLLNLCPDHLDRYVDVDRYYADKARLFDNADEESRWVLNGEDEAVRRMAEPHPGTRRYFRVAGPLADDEAGAFLSDTGMLTLRSDNAELELVDRGALRLLGSHNVANALAACLVAFYVGVPVPSVRRALTEFEPPPHRLQPVADRDGILWLNDSKATNVASTRVALRALDRPVVLLLGGRAKGQSFAGLAPDLTGRARAVIAYGEGAPQIESELGASVPVERVDGPFEGVVRRARELARSGDAILLSPACASFDMFRDYEDRGERFTRLAAGGAG